MLSVGIPGATPPDVVRRVASEVEAAGYHALWVNDTPGGDALAALAVAAEATSTLGLATGVLPLDRHEVAELLPRVRDLPAERTRLGIGSGGAPRGLSLLEHGVAGLRAAGLPVVVGGLGPRTRALAARIADGLLLNWLTPATAADAIRDLREDAGRRPVDGILYARTIASPVARPALEAEAARYAGYPAYAANFARLGIDPIATTIDLAGDRPLAGFDAVDELVLRAVTATDSAAELLELIDAGAAPR